MNATPRNAHYPKPHPPRLNLIRHLMIAGGALITASLLFLFTLDQVFMPYYLKTGVYVEAPDLLGKTVPEATAAIAKGHLTIFEEKREFHNQYPADTIYLQIPAAGTHVKPGRRIRVFVSNGARPIIVPDVLGKSLRNARLAIQDAGLAVSQEVPWIPSNEYLYGMVARQSPEAGAEVSDTMVVTLYVSNGRRVSNVVMPNLLNLDIAAAKDSLIARHFNMGLVRIQREEQPDLLPDTVIDQYPEAGRPASTSDEVIIIVSDPGRQEKEQ